MTDKSKSAGICLVHTFELLELILLHLVPLSTKSSRNSGAARQAFRNDHVVGMKTLLKCQRVNKTFRSTIVNSLPLRKALFLERPIAWNGSQAKENNVILVSNSWRVSQDFIVDVKAKWRMSKKGKVPKISLQMEPKYIPDRTADQQHLWRKMYFYDAEYHVDRIRVKVPRGPVAEIVPQRGDSLTASAIWEEVLGNAKSRGYLEDYLAENSRTEGGLVAPTRCLCFRCYAGEWASIASTVRERWG